MKSIKKKAVKPGSGTNKSTQLKSFRKSESSKPGKKKPVSRNRSIRSTGVKKVSDKFRDMYSDVVNNALVGIYAANLKGDILYVNKAMVNMLGFASEEDLMKKRAAGSYKNARDRKRLIDRLKKNGFVENYDIELISRDSKTINVIVNARLENDVITGMILDITERKLSKDLITKAKVAWEVTFDNVMDMVILVDKDLNIVRCNKSFSKFASKPIYEVIGHNFYEYLFPSDQDQREQCGSLIRNEQEIVNTEVQTKDGHWFYVNSCPVKDERGRFIHAVIVATDISGIKNSERKITDSRQELKKRVADLEKFYNIAIDREMKMRSLKKEMKRLRDRLLIYEPEGKDEA
ncbi:MAG TPA: PAS domain S-box protein [Nitrospirae bacterium]|nr:PAS domain S-box protein [Nitrospirota bacterium]